MKHGNCKGGFENQKHEQSTNHSYITCKNRNFFSTSSLIFDDQKVRWGAKINM
jgi:hypothetical protein